MPWCYLTRSCSFGFPLVLVPFDTSGVGSGNWDDWWTHTFNSYVPIPQSKSIHSFIRTWDSHQPPYPPCQMMGEPLMCPVYPYSILTPLLNNEPNEYLAPRQKDPGFKVPESVLVLVAQSCPTFCEPIDYSLPGSSVHGIFLARILEWVAISFSRGSSWLRD